MTTPMDLADAFQPNYRTSRERLLAGAHALAPRLGTLVDSRAIARRGPDGETLALDFTVFGARRPRHALVLSSGTHGVEGYTGSAIQHHVLAHVLPRLRLAPGTAVVLLPSREHGPVVLPSPPVSSTDEMLAHEIERLRPEGG